MTAPLDRALTHLADFLAVGAHGMLGAGRSRLLSLDEPGHRWPRVRATTGFGDAYSDAVVNGTAAHLLDWDDVMLGVPSHPGAVIWPALLATAPRVTTVRELLLGFTVGVRAIAELSSALGSEHYERGWHPTATIGRMGAAYAAAFVRHKDRRIAWQAMQLAAVTAAGVTDVFGTSVKPVQVGLAAGGAAHAALLAAEVTDVPDVLSPETSLGRLLGLRRAPTAAAMEQHDGALDALRIKTFPCCFFAHAPVLGVMALMRDTRGSSLSGSIGIRVSTSAARVCAVQQPETVDQAKFSLPFLVSAAVEGSAAEGLGLLDGTILSSSDIACTARNVTVAADSELNDLEAVVEAWGRTTVIDMDGGSAGLSTDAVRAKLASLPPTVKERVESCLSPDRASRSALLGSPISTLAADLFDLDESGTTKKRR